MFLALLSLAACSGKETSLPGTSPQDSAAPDTAVVDTAEPVELSFFVLLHTGEGTAPVCASSLTALRNCYAASGATDDDGLASACEAFEASVSACELDAGADRSCKLEGFDLTRDRTDARYDHQLHVRYEHCRDGLKDVLSGLQDIGVRATVQLHGGFLENLAYEDALGGGWSFQADLVGRGHEVSLHSHAECDANSGTDSAAFCSADAEATSFGSVWGEAADAVGDDTEPDAQGESDARLDSLLGVLSRAAALGGYFASSDPVSSYSGWGVPHRLSETPELQVAALQERGISVITSTAAFDVSLDEGCVDLGALEPAARMAHALPHPIEIADGLLYYDSPAPLWGQDPDADPLNDEDTIAAFSGVLSCIEARTAGETWAGQAFVWSGTSHLHNMIQSTGSIDKASYPSGVVELAAYQEMMTRELAAWNEAQAPQVALVARTLSEIEAARSASGADYRVSWEPL